MGDFNFPEINWVNNEVSTNINSDQYKFYECIQDNFLFSSQHICSLTRFRCCQNSNLLDLVFTNEEDIITDTPVGKSDH